MGWMVGLLMLILRLLIQGKDKDRFLIKTQVGAI
jgi:hypothetical protein